MTEQKTVDTPSAAYKAAQPALTMIETILGGTAALRAAGETYLPKEPAESPAAYTVRLGRTFLEAPGLEKAIQQFTDAVFQSDVEVENDTGALRDILDDTDGLGNNVTVFARQVFRSAVSYGMTFIQAGFPDTRALAEEARQRNGGVLTLADREAMGLRPFLIHRPRKDVIGWRGRDVGGRMLPDRVRIREMYDEPAQDQWDDDNGRVQVRVLTPGAWEIWRLVAATGEWAQADAGDTAPVSRVPLVPLYLDDEHGFFTASPPLLALAWLNLCHWQSSSDQRNILKIARVPLLFGRGFTDEEVKGGLTLSANQALFTSNPQAALQFVEHTGSSIQAGRDDLEALADRMAAWASDFLAQDASPGMAATSKAIDQAQTQSMVQAMANQTADAINAALDIACEWMEAPAGSVRIAINVKSISEQIGGDGEGGRADPVQRMAANAR